MPASTRTEHDLLGSREIPAEALWGIHTARAVDNFPLSGRPVHPRLIRAFGLVKLACARTNRELGFLDDRRHAALESACLEMASGLLDSHVLVDALQGGAGTSTNLNVCEVLANRALQLMGLPPGDHTTLSPLDDVNRHQSTNDTYPTALRIAAIQGIRILSEEVLALQEAFQDKETQFAHVVKIGRTELQDAVLTTMGRTCSAWAEAFGRDRWRIYKCEERLRVVNLGGTAIGTGLGAPRKYIFLVGEHLRSLTKLGLARAENLVEATQNADVFAEVSGILRACAVNLQKVCGDLRLLSSGPDAGLGELHLPERQAGSSIMPGKVNPVIPEAVTQAAMAALAHDAALTTACASGCLELNPFLPLIADALLTEIDLLTSACRILRTRCVEGLVADEPRCLLHVTGGTACLTALVDVLGYQASSRIAKKSREEGLSVREAVQAEGLLTPEQFDELISPEAVTRLGSPPPPSPQKEESE